MRQIVLIALLVQNAVQQQPAAGAIQGMVVKAGTTGALSKAIVEVRGDDESAPPMYATTTESDGRFLFQNVRPGRYRLVTTRSGYVRRPLSVTVSEGQGQTPVVQIAMTATGAIQGRVYGNNAEPLGNVEVQALKPTYEGGRRGLTPVLSVRTDDRGEYRLFWLAPGRYYVSATHPDGPVGAMGRTLSFAGNFLSFAGNFGFGGGGQMVRGTGDPALASTVGPFSPSAPKDERYVPVYFPGTIDDHAAAAIDLRAGADLGGVDIALAPVHAHHVRGVVINGATGQVAQYAGLKVIGATSFPDGPDGPPGASIDGRAPIELDGSFDLALFPGPHTLIGTAGSGVGYVSLEVGDSDVEGVQIVAMPLFNIPGRIVTDGPVDGAALANVRISLRRDLLVPATPSSYSLVPATPSSYSLMRPDGSFVVEATPGDYHVNVAPLLNLPGYRLPPVLSAPKSLERAYVKSIRLANIDVLNGGVRLERPPASPLEIVIGTNPSVLDGSVLNDTQIAAGGATVALLPDVRGRSDLYKTATTDPSGRFHLDRIPPGDYKAFAWEEVNDGAWQDPEFMRENENRGTPIRIGEGTTATVRLLLIPRQ